MIQHGSAPVAMIPYVNMAPYRQMGPPPGCHFVPLVPKKSITALLNGHVVAAAVPVGGLPLLRESVEYLGEFGIAARKESMSVLFFSDRPFTAMDSSCHIQLTDDSASSVRLLYLLWRDLIGVPNSPGLAGEDDMVNGVLQIGDEALKSADQLRRGQRLFGDGKQKEIPVLTTVTDLAALWRQSYGLPFVFARWVVRQDTDERVKASLNQWLETFRDREAQMVSACIASAARQLKIDSAVIKRYFHVIHRCLDPQDLEGQKRFLTELGTIQSHPVVGLGKP